MSLQQSQALYFARKATMIIWSPFILDVIARLRDAAPVTLRRAAARPEDRHRHPLRRPSNPEGAAWGDIRYLGVTADANTDVAAEFVMFSLGEGYESTLAIAPEGQVPGAPRECRGEKVRQCVAGAAGRRDRKAPLTELYAAETIEEIVGGLDSAARWGSSPHRRRGGRSLRAVIVAEHLGSDNFYRRDERARPGDHTAKAGNVLHLRARRDNIHLFDKAEHCSGTA